MKRKINGFTLAEVLIALTIIGVVAALTIPTLVQKTNKQEYVSALQKAYSTLSQATNMIIAENGSPKGEEGWVQNTGMVYDLYKKHLNVLKDCSNNNSTCFATSYKHLNGNTASDFNWRYSDASTRRIVLSDGIAVMFDTVELSSNCATAAYGSSGYCARIWVDLNGPKKPNQWGRDTFMFLIEPGGLAPMGCSSGCVHNGAGCTCKVLKEGKMDY